MKKLKIFGLLLCGLILSLTLSCEKDEEINNSPNEQLTQYSFDLEGINTKTAKRSTIDISNNPAYVRLSIEDSQGNTIYNNKKVPIVMSDGRYKTEMINLPNGDYKLTHFVVYNSSNEVIYLSPKEGSKMQTAVLDALPMEFTNDCKVGDCGADTNKTRVQVVEKSDEVTEEDCGYHLFDFDVIDIFRYCIKAYCEGDTETIIPVTIKVEAKKEGEDFQTLIENHPNDSKVLSNPVVISSIYEEFRFTITHNGEEQIKTYTAIQLAEMEEPFCLEFPFTCDGGGVACSDQEGYLDYSKTFNQTQSTGGSATVTNSTRIVLDQPIDFTPENEIKMIVQFQKDRTETNPLTSYLYLFGGDILDFSIAGNGAGQITHHQHPTEGGNKLQNLIRGNFNAFTGTNPSDWIEISAKIINSTDILIEFRHENGDEIQGVNTQFTYTLSSTANLNIRTIMGNINRGQAPPTNLLYNPYNDFSLKSFSIGDTTWNFNECDTNVFSNNQNDGNNATLTSGDGYDPIAQATAMQTKLN